MKEKSEDNLMNDCGHDSILNELVTRVGKVRNRLILEAILKTLAMALIIFPLYVGVYAWLDHHFHLGPLLRILALFVLVVSVTLLLLYWAKIFLAHISLSRAANHIESESSYHQQLVAAIEYYEQQTDYPYSKGLVEHMIRQVYSESNEAVFIDTVKKWPSLLCLAVIICSVVCIIFLVNSNYRYYDRYFDRLVKPIAKIEPLPPTELLAVSGDIVAESNETLDLAASISGRIPEGGTLFLQPQINFSQPNDTGSEKHLKIPVFVTMNPEKKPVFNAKISLSEKGNYSYYFQANKALSEVHTIRIAEFPKIESMTAEVVPSNSKWAKPYTEEIKDDSLSVFRGSHVTLKIKTNQPLKDAKIRLPDGQQLDGRPYEHDGFTTAFDVCQAGAVEFRSVNKEGFEPKKSSGLQLNIKKDNCPEFKLLSPTGDYIANNVASVPIEFEVSDDFALSSASLFMEFNNGEILRIPGELQGEGSKKMMLSYLLELEDYDLDISDSIIFYASGKDIDTEVGFSNETAYSTPYFLEIRPYRKLIKQPPPSLPSMEKQGVQRPEGHESLMAILEYNRAFLKKTWALAQNKELLEQEKFHMDAICDDIGYAGIQLTMIRDDPKYDFTQDQVLSINSVLSDYDQAVRALVKYKPSYAIPPEKHGYHQVRELIKELMECPPPIGGTKPETRDKLELKDPVHVTRYEKERIEWQMEKLSQELAELAKEQEKLEKEFVKFLEEQKKNKLEQKVTDAKTWKEEHETEIPRTPPLDIKVSQDKQETPTVQGAMLNVVNLPPSAGGGATNNNPVEEQKQQQEKIAEKKKNVQQGQDNSKPSDSEIATNEMLRILRAHQKMLQKRLDELSTQLAKVPIPDEPVDKSGTAAEDVRKAAQEHLANAEEYMGRFDDELASQYYDTEISEESLNRAEGHLVAVRNELDLANLEMAKEYANADLQLAMESENIAQQLEELAEATDRSLSEIEKQQLKELLKQADEFIGRVPELLQQGDMGDPITVESGPQIPALPNSKVQELDRDLRYSRNQQHYFNGPPGSMQDTQQQNRNSRVVSKSFEEGLLSDPDEALLSEAREKAKHFWSVAIKARQKASRLSETQCSHPEFIDDEINFYEKTAEYGMKRE